MAKRTYEFDILAKLDEATASVNKFASTTQKQLSQLNMLEGVQAIKEGFEILSSVISPVIDAIESGFDRAVTAATEAEASQFKLANQLRITGDAAHNAFEKMDEFAEAMSKSTTFTTRAEEASLGLGKQFLLTNSEAERALKVANDLAAATGTSLDDAMRRVSQTFEGFVDRSLGRMIPGLKNMSIQSLLAGNALGAIESRVKGTAQALTHTFGGALEQTKNASERAFEALGKLFINNDAVVAGVKGLGDLFNKLADILKKNSKEIENFITGGLVLLAKTLPYAIALVHEVVSQFTTYYYAAKAAADVTIDLAKAIVLLSTGHGFDAAAAIASIKDDLKQVKEDFTNSIAAQNTGFGKVVDLAQELADKIEAAAKNAKNLGVTVDGVDKSATGFAKRFADKFGPEQIAAATAKINELRSSLDAEVKSKINDITSQPINGVIKLALAGQQELADAKAKIDQQIAQIINSKDIPDEFKALAQKLGEKAKEGLTEAFSNNSLGETIGNQVIQSMQKGAAGAEQAISGAIGGVVAAFFGEAIGKLVQGFIDLLASGAAQVKQTMKGFIEAIPDVVESILEAIPTFIDTLFDEIPIFFQKIFDSLPRIWDAFVKGIPGFIKAFVSYIPMVMSSLIRALPDLIKAIIRSIPEIVKGFIDGMIEGTKAIVQAMIDQITGAGGKDGLFGGGNGKGGTLSDSGIPIVSQLGDVLGLADGGRIPDVPQLDPNGGGGLVRLHRNEQVLSGDLTNQLQAFLDGNSGAQPVHATVQLVMDKSVLAEQMFKIRTRGYRT